MRTDPRLGWAGIREDRPDPFIDEQLAVQVDGGRRFFTMQEWLILKFLRRHENRFNTIPAIEAWLYSGRHGDWPSRNAMAVHISKIRKKLKGSGYAIRSHWGGGYMLERDT